MNNRKRQVIVIMTDSQCTDMVGCYAHNGLQTPNIDRLAENGMKFEKAYTTQPLCCPARSALFTGLYPHSNGAWSNCLPLGDNVKTIGQRLSDKDIHTAYIGKWHLDGGDYFGLGRCPNGWDENYWYDMKNYLDELSIEDRIASRDPSTMSKRKLDETFTFGHRCSNRAIDFLRNNKDEDFLLVVSYDEPHHPFICPEPYSSMYKDYTLPQKPSILDTLENKPEHQKVWAGECRFQNRENVRVSSPAFFGCNTYVDYEIGRVIDAIDEYAENALVVYTSDHGDMLNSHCLHAKGPAVYEEVARIPFIVRWPEIIEPESVNVNPISHIDLCPTIMNFFSLPIPKLFEGKSLMNTLKNKDKKIQDEVFIEFARYETDHDGFGGFQPLRAVYDGRYKLCINLLSSDELYDLKQDPYEINNLINSDDYDEIKEELLSKILDWMNRTRDPFRGYHWEMRSWRKNAKKPSWEYTGMTRQRENEEYEPKQLDYMTGVEMAKAVRNRGDIIFPSNLNNK